MSGSSSLWNSDIFVFDFYCGITTNRGLQWPSFSSSVSSVGQTSVLPGGSRGEFVPRLVQVAGTFNPCKYRSEGLFPCQKLLLLLASTTFLPCGLLHLQNSYRTSSHPQTSDLLDFPFYLLLPYSSAETAIESALFLRTRVIKLYPPTESLFKVNCAI